jgi:hypothetical protein
LVIIGTAITGVFCLPYPPPPKKKDKDRPFFQNGGGGVPPKETRQKQQHSCQESDTKEALELRRFFELCGTHEPLSSSRSDSRLPLAVATGGDRVPGPSSSAAADWSSVSTTAPPLLLLCPPLIGGGGRAGEQKRLKPASMALTEKRSCVKKGENAQESSVVDPDPDPVGSGSGFQHSTRSYKNGGFLYNQCCESGIFIPDPGSE